MANGVNGSGQCPKFDSIIFGENGKYRATRHGDKVLIQGKDGSLRTTDVETFMKCLAASLPKMKGQPEKDTFVSKLNKLNSELFDLQEKKETDTLAESMGKSLHNFSLVTLNPIAALKFWSNPGKY